MNNVMWYTILKVSLPASSLAFIGATMMTMIFLYIYTNKKLVDPFLNYIIGFIIIWKVSYLVTDWQSFIDYPLTLVYFNGGIFGFVAASIFTLLYAIREFLKKKESSILFEQLLYFILMFSSYQFLFAILNDGDLSIRLVTVVLSLIIGVAIVHSFVKNNRAFGVISLSFIFIYMVFSIVVEPLSWQQPKLVLLSIGLIYSIMLIFQQKRSEMREV